MKAPQEVPAHLLPFRDGTWAVWRIVGLRSAGFPAREIDRIAAPECFAAARRALAVAERVESLYDEALAEVNERLDDLRAAGGWNDAKRRKPLLAALWELKGRTPGEAAGEIVDGGELTRAEREAEAARERFGRAYARAAEASSRAIDAILDLPGFSEAVLWQNRRAYRNALGWLRRHPADEEERNTHRRRHEELVASYIQRYTVKNDTIGYFGPMGWARWRDEGPAIAVRVGESLVKERRTFLESWCLQALADAVRDPTITPWLAPRRIPYARVVGRLLHLPFRKPVRLSPARAAVLEACDGTTSARDIAERTAARGETGTGSPGEILALLAEMEQEGLVEQGLLAPLHPFGEREIREQLAAIEDPEARAAATELFDALEERRREVAAAAGDEAALDRAIASLEEEFVRRTGEDAHRSSGTTYGGRTLFYEDCSRDVEVDLGPELLARLEAPLGLVLASARWFTVQIGELFRRLSCHVHQSLSGELGTVLVPGPVFVETIQGLLERDLDVDDKILPHLHRAWSRLLGVEGASERGERRVRHSSESLRAGVSKLFAVDAPGWELARYHNPDVMISATGPEAIRGGDYELVLGELHVGSPSLNSWIFLGTCDHREEIFRCFDEDLRPRLVFLPARDRPGVTGRTFKAYLRTQDRHVAPLREAVRLPGLEVVSPSSLVIGPTPDGELVVRSLESDLEYGIVEAFGEILSGVAQRFSLLGEAPHLPRVAIDRVVVQRESWHLPAGKMTFATVSDSRERYLAAVGWSRRHGLPERVFVKSPVEKKPIHVDLRSPVAVDLWSRLVRQTQESDEEAKIRVTEMHPSLEDAWLPDATGNRYVSELRLTVLDRGTPALATVPGTSR